jgi:hypothetical protein
MRYPYPMQAATMIAEHLLSDCTPATDLLAQLSGQHVTMQAKPPKHYWLTDSNRQLLRRGPGVAWGRTGQQVTQDGTLAANTQLILLTELLPEGALARIEAGESCGTVLGPYGMTRQDRAAAITGSDPAVISSAVLMLDEPCGLAYECITRDFAELVQQLSVGAFSAY